MVKTSVVGARRSLRLSKKQALEIGEDSLQHRAEECELPTLIPEKEPDLKSNTSDRRSQNMNKQSNTGKESVNSSICLVKEAEFEAAEALADLQLKRLQIEENRIKKRLELQKLRIQGSQKSSISSNDSMEIYSNTTPHCKVSSWINDQIKENSDNNYQQHELHEERNSRKNPNEWITRMWLNKDLPDFYGDHEEWPNFINMFKESTNLCSFTNAENMYRLRKCLKGKAKETVQNMLISSENLKTVIEMLERRFGRPDHIIENLMHKAEFTPAPKIGNPHSLIDFANVIRNMVATMKTLNYKQYLINPVLLKKLVNKLPEYLQAAWGEVLVERNEVNLEDFADWIDKRADAASCLSSYRPILDEKSNKKKETKNHRASECRKKKICDVTGCERLHHKLLHYKKSNQNKPEDQKEKKVENQGLEIKNENQKNFIQAEPVHHSTIQDSKVLLRILPVTLQGPLGKIDTYALLDEGSTVTLIDSKIASKLGLEGKHDPLNLQWTNSVTRRDENSKRVCFQINGFNNDEKFKINQARTVENLTLPVQSVNLNQIKHKWNYLKQVHVTALDNAQPTLLIGQDNCDIIVARDIIEGPRNGPVATKTKLGWVLHGNISMFRNRVQDESVFFHKEIQEDLLHQLVKDSFTTESFGVKIVYENSRSKEDIRSQEIMDLTSKRIGNRWETGLLWKKQNIELPESKKNAFNRLKLIERKMDQDPLYAEGYETKIKDYLDKGYLQKLSKTEVEKQSSKIWYLPHFAVTNVNKPGKIRIVFDAAAKSNGMSLNDNLMKGPDLLCSLIGVLLKFRQRKIGFGADIREMFHQVRIRKEDCSAQRILWRGMRREGQPDIYELKVMTFGATCSPCSAQEIKNKNAKEFEEEYPEAVKAILKRHYVDDYFDSTHTEDQAIKLIKEVIEVHRRGGFDIRSWVCTSQYVLKQLPEQYVADTNKNIKSKSEIQTERVLGLNWNPHEDVFSFNLKFHKINQEILNNNKNPTKREFLKIIMSVFDPLGFLAKFMVNAKILLQDIWKSQIGWDDELPLEINQRWEKWLVNFKKIKDIQIPRCYSIQMENARNVQLHVFCDASEKAFGAVAYLRIEAQEEINTAFIMARTRVAPLRPMSIPRLELQAAVMASRMGTTIQKELEILINSVHYWSDSQTVIYWLQSEATRFKSFVAHRVGEINELTDNSSWHWISTKENVADELTRELNIENNDRWFNGPTFLKLAEAFWPRKMEDNAVKTNLENTVQEEILEIRSNHIGIIFQAETQILPDPARFSSWTKLIRTTAWILRFVNKCLRRKYDNFRMPSESELTFPELHEAESLWWHRVQQDSFADEIKYLKLHKVVPKRSRLQQLNIVLDDNNIIRIRSRLSETPVEEFKENPIVLDPDHEFTKLLIDHYHKKNLHHGRERTLNDLRQKYWILNARRAVKRTYNNCMQCKIYRARPQPPQMAPLPDFRSTPTVRPFVVTGMDYFGPMEVTIGRRREKRYGVLFTCMVTRAIHLEIAHSLSTDSAIMALRRMIARRGPPEKILSDNGTNFRGADKELKAALSELDQNKIQQNLSGYGIQWNFIPPASPHMGGCWERLVRSVKTALKVILKEQAPKEEVLQTLFAEVEHIVNNRPLTYVSEDPDDLESLTPNHFLIGKNATAPQPGKFENHDLFLRKQWRKAQKLADNFWKRWVIEYLPTLVKHSKWKNDTNTPQLNDVVIVVDENSNRNTWLKGLIVKLFPGKDGRTRVADVKTKNGIYRRPVIKLIPLK